MKNATDRKEYIESFQEGVNALETKSTKPYDLNSDSLRRIVVSFRVCASCTNSFAHDL